MADHLNVAEPDPYSEKWARRVTIAKLEAELKITQTARDALESDLEAIFTRIGRGETAELHYRSGRVITIGAISERSNG